MTVTTEAPPAVPAAWQKAAITSSLDHRYTHNGITYPSVTTIIDLLGSNFMAASTWGAKHAAAAAVRLIPELPAMLEAVGPEGTAKAIASRESWGPDPSGNILGSEVHDLISKYLTATPFTPGSPAANSRLDAFAKWWEASGWKLRLSEAMIVRPSDDKAQGWGGTLDILAYDRDGKTVLADVKTGNLYPKVALQLAGYSMGSLIQPAGSLTAYPMPRVDRYAVIHVTAKGVTEVPTVVETSECMTFLACLEVYNWQRSVSGRRL